MVGFEYAFFEPAGSNSNSFIGYHFFDFGQLRSLVDGKVKLDREGKYSVHFHLSSGHAFNWAFSDVIGGNYTDHVLGFVPFDSLEHLVSFTRAAAADHSDLKAATGSHSNGWQMYMLQLYISASPVKQVEFQYGSLAIAKGFSSEVTTYDDDGYLSGEPAPGLRSQTSLF